MFTRILSAVFNSSLPSPELALVKQLKTLHPNSQHATILQNSESAFPLSAYLVSLGIKAEIVEAETYCDLQYDHSSKLVYRHVMAGVTAFTFESTGFRAYKASWRNEMCGYVLYHLVFDAPDDALGEKLSSAVYTWSYSLREEIWVFEEGHWAKSKELYKAIKSSSWDSIVLKDTFKERLRRDTMTYFSSRDVYQSLEITWKRGLLLLGPPGNGKTESIKALINDLDAVPLYVKSFTTQGGPERGVRTIFDHARKHAPCVLVLEDLDAMVVPEVRSFFLNELDGLAQNEGILTIATTNHPERIDDAILNRPSRFDVKYDFALPDHDLRKAFARKWIDKVHRLDTMTEISFSEPDKTAGEVADRTDGWSFAFLKELFVSFMLRIAHDHSLRSSGVEVPSEPSESTLLKQVEQLAKQIIHVDRGEQTSGDGTGASTGRLYRGPQISTQAYRMAVPGPTMVHPGTNF